jgi:hypothetical protein
MFVGIPREQSVYCENCDTVSVGPGEDKRCGVCLSEAIPPLSKLIKFAAEPPVLLAAAAPLVAEFAAHSS